MRFQGAIITEQGITFGILIVKNHALDSLTKANSLIAEASAAFGGIPTVLMAQDHTGRARYYGRRDIVNFMVNVPLSAVPWREYTITPRG
ncbi:hypothetical protein [Candidatus Spongiisocius sp.]|uniref:hypothetical protein n=1 Tax=Candidatus Spongiisocius sp. TaxID=3101273 RepID=UPI003B599B98